MATFYLLPPRPLLGERLTDFLKSLLPGLATPPIDAAALDGLFAAVRTQPDEVYVVYREELTDGEDTATALQHGFGAEPGDEIVEVRAGASSPRRWRIAE